MEDKFVLTFDLYKCATSLAIKYVRKRTDKFLFYLALVISLIVVHNYLNYQMTKIEGLVSKTTKTTAPYYISLLMLTKLWYWINLFTYRIIFEILITPVGGIISSAVMNRILLSENQNAIKLHPLTVEYFISSGSKAIAKILRVIFVDLISSLCGITKNFTKVFSSFQKNMIYVPFIFALCFILFTCYEFYKLQTFFRTSYKISVTDCKKEDYYIETVNSLKIVKSYSEGEKMASRFSGALVQWESLISQNRFFITTQTFIFTLMSQFAIAVVSLIYYNTFGVREAALNDTLNTPDVYSQLSTFRGMINDLPTCFLSLFIFYMEYTDSVTAAKNLISLLKFTKEDLNKKIRIDSFNDKITIKNLQYKINDRTIIKNASFEITKGMKCAVFGRNGSGKSSIIRILLGLDEYDGDILFDDIDFKAICKADYRKLICYVPQDTKLFNDTIYYNLTLGNNKDYSSVIMECKRMGIHDTIMTFPFGYNTQVGTGGNSINGGLRQKIFYARAFLCDVEIFIFDEPTNNLDESSSKFLLNYLHDEQYKEKTFVVICHDKELVDHFPILLHFHDGVATMCRNDGVIDH